MFTSGKRSQPLACGVNKACTHGSGMCISTKGCLPIACSIILGLHARKWHVHNCQAMSSQVMQYQPRLAWISRGLCTSLCRRWTWSARIGYVLTTYISHCRERNASITLVLHVMVCQHQVCQERITLVYT